MLIGIDNYDNNVDFPEIIRIDLENFEKIFG